MHALVPPHPGPVAAGTALGGDIGAHPARRRCRSPSSPGTSASTSSPWRCGTPLRRPRVCRHDLRRRGRRRRGPPTRRPLRRAFGTVLGLLLIPLVLISFNTVLTTLRRHRHARRGTGTWVERPPAASATPRSRCSITPARRDLRPRPPPTAPWPDDRDDPRPGPRPDLLDHPDHRRRRHVRRRAAHQRHRRRADRLALRPRPAAARSQAFLDRHRRCASPRARRPSR